jgi:prepilin-type processing-associated H-X9-DG protein
MYRHRLGLSLIETIVVVAIIGILVSLLVPAIQYGREAARNTVCQNNLRQIAAAVLSSESANRVIPPLYNSSFLPKPRSAVDEFNFHSWRTVILPQLEQSNLFAALNLALPTTTKDNQTAINVALAVFVCPSTSNANPTVPGILAWNDGKIPFEVIGTAARSDYELIGGVYVSPQKSTTSLDLRGVRFGVWGEPTYDSATGVALRYRTARLSDVTDGLSNTLLIGERAGRPDYYARGEPPDPYPYRNPAQHGQGDGQAAWAVSTHFLWTLYYDNQPINYWNCTGIYSFHPGGANVAFADGSVRFLKETTGHAVLTAIGTRAGAEIVADDY